jgi:ribonuclease D
MFPRQLPHKSDIASMDPFIGLDMEQIIVVSNEGQAELAKEELMSAGVVGFDTESKPTFVKGQTSGGPHVFQFATLEKAFIFHAHVEESHSVILDLLLSVELSKIGFDLRGDLQQIAKKYEIQPAGIVDLGRTFRNLGFQNMIGATSAVALLFQRRLLKSKSVTTSNWAAKELSERQLLYAANDAYAALRVYHALENS